MEAGRPVGLSAVIGSTLGMMLLIKFSGGMGLSYQGSVDLSALPPDLQQATKIELSQSKLAQLAGKPKNQFASDSMGYELQYGNAGQAYRIDESQASDELLELIDRLQPYIKLKAR